MLAGIYAHEKLGNTSIFKGGTCLKNCFFETYRFSADLDFTLRNGAHLDETFLKRVFAKSAHGFMMRRVSKSPGAGDVLLMAVRAEDGNPRSYRVDSFFGASPTQIGFSPGHPIELTPSGPQSILPTSRSGHAHQVVAPSMSFDVRFAARVLTARAMTLRCGPIRNSVGYQCYGSYVRTKY